MNRVLLETGRTYLDARLWNLETGEMFSGVKAISVYPDPSRMGDSEQEVRIRMVGAGEEFLR